MTVDDATPLWTDSSSCPLVTIRDYFKSLLLGLSYGVSRFVAMLLSMSLHLGLSKILDIIL